MEEKKPTFKEILQRHAITYFYFYEHCMNVPTEDINALYNHNVCVRSRGEQMIAFLNKEAGTSYTLDDIYLAKMY